MKSHQFIWLIHSNLVLIFALNINTDTDDFKSLVLNNDFFVDKTLMIEEFMQMLSGDPVPLILRPRGWGKTTNMDMLRRFYEIEVDDQGNFLSANQTINDKLFLGGEIFTDENSFPKKLTPLKISHVPSALEYMGKMPVIFIKLENVTGKCYDEIEQSIKLRIVRAFQAHRYLLNHTFESQIFDEQDLSKYFSGEFNTTTLKKSLYILSGLLYNFFRHRRVVVLVDDYDTPIINAYLEFGHRYEEYDKVVDLLDSMYAFVLRGNIFLHKGLVNGIMRISLDTLDHPIARFDKLESGALFNRRFSQYYGFTREEVEDLLEQIPLNVTFKEMDIWYGGYLIDERIHLIGDLVMKCILHNGSIGYYEQSGISGEPLLDKVFAIDKMQPKIQRLISGEKLPFNNFMQLTRIRWHVASKFSEFYTLFHYGYLNRTDTLSSPQIAIPNKQMKHNFELKSLRWVSNKFGVDSSQFISFAMCLSNGSMDQFRETLPKYLSNDAAAQLIKIGEKQSKAVYNAMKTALQTALSFSHEKTNDGPIDGFILIPKLDRSDMGIIFKYKTSNTQDDMISQAKSSVEEMNRYLNSTSLTSLHIRKIIKIGLSLCLTNVAIEYEIANISNTKNDDNI